MLDFYFVYGVGNLIFIGEPPEFRICRNLPERNTTVKIENEEQLQNHPTSEWYFWELWTKSWSNNSLYTTRLTVRTIIVIQPGPLLLLLIQYLQITLLLILIIHKPNTRTYSGTSITIIISSCIIVCIQEDPVYTRTSVGHSLGRGQQEGNSHLNCCVVKIGNLILARSIWHTPSAAKKLLVLILNNPILSTV